MQEQLPRHEEHEVFLTVYVFQAGRGMLPHPKRFALITFNHFA